MLDFKIGSDVEDIVLLCFSVVIWDLEAKAAVCGSPAAMTSAGKVHCLAFSNFRDDLIITGGE